MKNVMLYSLMFRLVGLMATHADAARGALHQVRVPHLSDFRAAGVKSVRLHQSSVRAEVGHYSILQFCVVLHILVH